MKNYNQTLRELSKSYPGQRIQNIVEAKKFFDKLISETESLINTDFLDSDNWDSLLSCDIDKQNNILFLFWKKNLEGDEKEIFGYSDICLAINFRELLFLPLGKKEAITISGYAMKDKDAIKLLKDNNCKSLAEVDKSMFHIDISRTKKEGTLELVRFLNTPMLSLLMFTKDIIINSLDSPKILNILNIRLLEKELNEIENIKLDENVNIIKLESIAYNIGSHLRRLLESLLKIFSSYLIRRYELGDSNNSLTKDPTVIKDYSHLCLGDLINIIKIINNTLSDAMDDKIITEIQKDINTLNTLSHDSGKRVSADDIKNLVSSIHSILTSINAYICS